MEDVDLQALTTKLDLLIQRVEQLKAQNRQLLTSEKAWREERAHLIDRPDSGQRILHRLPER